MSSAIILPIFYDPRMRRTNRRELFIKRFTSGCVVIATLFIVVGLSSATWYMTILGTFILMVVGLSGFCFKYCDRTSDSRAVRRAISISSRTARASTRHPVATAGEDGGTDIDLPPAYDNIVFDEPYSLHYIGLRAFDHPQSPPPPYEAIFNAANHQSTGHIINPDVPDYPSRLMPSALVVPHLALNHNDRGQSHMPPRTVTTEVPQTVVQEPPQAVAPEAPQVVAPETPQTFAREATQTVVNETPQIVRPDASQTFAPEAPQRVVHETPQTVGPDAPQALAQESPQTTAYEQRNHMPEQSVATAYSFNQSE